MDVEFRDLSYSAKQSLFGKKKEILKNINGRFLNGQLTGIMGASGAGKTTLLNILSGCKTNGVTGLLGLNDSMPRNENILRKYSCYIRQEEVHQPFLTVQESMELAVRLKLPSTRTDKENKKLIDDIVKNFAFAGEMNCKIEELSNSQRKQLSIALELVNDPHIFFLDEPTTGMDTVITNQCIKKLWELAHHGNRNVICTIHTPSAATLEQLDFVYILCDGKCIYQGHPRQLVHFLESVSMSCPISYNPADYVIELTEGNKSNRKILSHAIDNGEYIWNMEGKSSLQSKDFKEKNRPEMENRSRSPVSNWLQFWLLFKRMMIQQFRNKVGIYLQLFYHSVILLVFCSMFANFGNYGDDFFLHFKFALSLILIISYTWLLVPALTFPLEIALLTKEHFNKWYNLIPYYFAYTFSRIPLMLCLTFILILPIYVISGQLLELNRFLNFFLICVLVLFSAEGFGISIASFFSIIPSAVISTLLVAPLLALAFYGFDFHDQVSPTLKFLMNCSFMRLGFSGVILSMFGDDRPKLNCSDLYCHFADPKIILKYIGHDQLFFSIECLFLILHIIFYRIVAFIGMYYRVNIKN